MDAPTEAGTTADEAGAFGGRRRGCHGFVDDDDDNDGDEYKKAPAWHKNISLGRPNVSRRQRCAMRAVLRCLAEAVRLLRGFLAMRRKDRDGGDLSFCKPHQE